MQSNRVSGRQDALTLLRRGASGMPQDSVPALKVSAAGPLCTVDGFTPDAPRQFDGVDTTQLLARIMERHNDNAVFEQSPTSSSASPIVVAHVPLASESTNNTAVKPVLIFNTGATSGTSVNNVAGDYIVQGHDDEQLALKMALDKLAYAEGASWDPNLACLPGTRVTMLSLIKLWSRSLDNQSIFWLKGVAGSGKSAIAHAVAQALREEGRLASAFFFNHSIPSRNTPQTLFTTIARDIAAHHPAFAADISAALEDEPSLASASLSRQFEAFIAEPLRRHPVGRSLVVVIDALDETIQDESNADLLTILRDEVSKLPPQLRILITSRPTWNIEQFLSSQDHIYSHAIDIYSIENRQDIGMYADSQLRSRALCSRMGPSWPDEALIAELKLLAEGLFIWIATICSYLHSAYNPKAKLRGLLSKSLPSDQSATKKIDGLYSVILEVSGDWQDADFVRDYGRVMGAVMAAKRPLSLAALKALHGDGSQPEELSPKVLLERFGSVLVGLHNDHEPIRVLHLSFREFITGRAANTQDTRKFHISEKAHSQRLAELCLRTMVRELTSEPILGTGYLALDDHDHPDIPGDDRAGIPELIGVSDQLLYSCESWSDHISDVGDPNPAVLQVVQEFISHHNTVWIEIVSSKSTFRGSLAVWHWLEVHAPELKEFYNNESQASMFLSLTKRLEYAGRLEESLTAIQEGVALRRALAEERPAMFNAKLAGSLNNMSNHFSDLGRQDGALTAIQEALSLYRGLAAEQPAVFNVDLAIALGNMSNRLSNLGRQDAALAAMQEALGLHRALAAEQPATFNADFAMALNNMSNRLSALGNQEEALIAIQEALYLYRGLAAERPAEFNVNLAMALGNMSNHLSDLGKQEESLAAIQEALGLFRALAAERPAVFNVNLAMALGNMSNHLSDLGKQEGSLAAIQEALVLFRALAAERPAVFNTGLAMTLSNISSLLSDLVRQEEALAAMQEAVGLYRGLAAEQPAAFNANLAMALGNMSDRLSDLGRQQDALTAIQEALGLFRPLAAGRPAEYNIGLAISLSNISNLLSELGSREEALAAMQEALSLHRALAVERPGAFNADLAKSLNDMSKHLSDFGRHDEALAAIQEAVDLRRVLAAERPAAYNAKLALSLNNMSLRLADLGRQEEALTMIQEAVDLRRALAVQRPAAFNVELAQSLDDMSNRLSDLGRKDEALQAMQEALSLNGEIARC